MAQAYSLTGPSSATSELPIPPDVNGASFVYHPALPNFSGFPGLSSLLQSMASQAATTVQTPTAQTPTQPPYTPQLARPPSSGNSDLERLERLKKEILDGQNPIYKAVPQPDFLESLYLGRSLQRTDTVPAHPEQIGIAHGQSTNNQASLTNGQAEGNSAQEKSAVPTPLQSTGPMLLPSELLNLTRSEVQGLGQASQRSQNEPNVVKNDQRSPFLPSSAHNVVPGLTSSDNLISVKSEQTSSDHLLSRTDTEVADGLAKFPLPSHGILSKDPPYDPKESLRRNDDAFSYDDRNRRIDSYDTRRYESHYARNDEKDRDREQTYDKRCDYRYDDKRPAAEAYGDRRTSTNEPKDQRPSALGRQDSRQSLAEFDTRHQSSGDSSPTKHMNGNDLARYNQLSANGSQYKSQGSSADDRRPPMSEFYPFARGSMEERSRTDTRGQEYSSDSRSYYASQVSENGVSSAGNRGLEERRGGRPLPLGERIGIRIPLENRISSPPSEKFKAPLHERIGDRVQEDRMASAQLRVDTESRFGITRSATDQAPYVDEAPKSSTLTHDIPPLGPVHARPPSPRVIESNTDLSSKGRHPEGPVTRDSKGLEAVKGHYERPVINLERERYPPNDRNGPSLESREWRERGTYPSVPSRKPGAYPPRDDRYYDGRDWIPNDCVNKVTSIPLDSDREIYKDRPHASRPPPEVYPPHDRVDDRYAHPDYRDPARIRPRSPSIPLEPLDDLRPVKRVREGGPYYDARRGYPYGSAEPFPSRGITPPPPSSTSSYYDTHPGYPPRDIYAEHDRAPDLGYYDRRTADLARPRSPPYAGRAIYSRPDLDRDGRYGMPPPRTA